MQTINIQSIKLFPRQKEVVDKITSSNSMYHILKASRQSGKTTLATQLMCFWSINNDKTKTLYQVQDLTTGAKMTIDENYNIELKKCDNAEMLGTLDFLISTLEEQRDKLLPTIELSEVIEA